MYVESRPFLVRVASYVTRLIIEEVHCTIFTFNLSVAMPATQDIASVNLSADRMHTNSKTVPISSHLQALPRVTGICSPHTHTSIVVILY